MEAGALAGWQHRSGELVPDLDKEAGMVGFVQNRLGVVDVMLVAGVDDWMMGMKPFRFVSPMQVHPIHVKEECVGNKQEFHVGGHDEWEQHNRGRSNELIDVFVRNDRKGRRIVKGVMVLVKLLVAPTTMAHSMPMAKAGMLMPVCSVHAKKVKSSVLLLTVHGLIVITLYI